MKRREGGKQKGQIFSDGEEKSKELNSSFLLSLVFLVSWVAVCLAIAFHFHYALPPVPKNPPPSEFSEARAWGDLNHITSNIGRRVVGTKGERETSDYILKRLEEIRQEVAASGSKMVLEISTQNTTGSHRFDFAGKICIKSYTGLINVIARVSCGKECEEHGALLINTHYDTTPGTPGAMDAAAPIAIMLELIRNLMNRPFDRYAVIFLFNGAEESLQDASHGFITQHSYRDVIRAVINLEGCGNSGKAILFQAGDSHLVEAFKEAPFPVSNVAANELFKTGAIISDTDYRQFVQYGEIGGLDLAYYQNSYLYHTTRDLVETIAPGSVQHMGQNVLEVISHVLSTSYLETQTPPVDDLVYFDILGKYLITYSWDAATFLHVSLLLSGLFLSFSRFKDRTALLRFFKTTLRFFLSFLLALIFPLLLAAFFSFGLGFRFRWFSREYLPLFFFGPFSIFGCMSVHFTFERINIIKKDQEIFSIFGMLTFCNLAMTIATFFGVRTSYFFSIWSVFLTIGLFFQKFMSSSPTYLHPLTYVLSFSFPLIYTSDTLASLFDMMVPLTGRMGYTVPADLIVATVTGIPSFFLFSLLLPFFQRFGNFGRMGRLFGALGVLLPLALNLGLHGFDRLHPRRVYVQHLWDVQNNRTLMFVAGSDFETLDPMISTLTHFSPQPLEKSAGNHSHFWEGLYPVNYFLNSYCFETGQIIMESHPKTLALMRLEVEKSVYDPSKNSREIFLKCHHEDYPWTILRFKANVSAWSIPGVDPVPQADSNKYILRLVGGYGVTEWQFSMTVEGNEPISFELLGMRHEASLLMKEVFEALPDWTDESINYAVVSQVFTL